MTNKFRMAALCFLGAFCLAGTIQAQEEGGSGEAEWEPNIFEVFGGATLHDGESDGSFGVAYERRLSEGFGLGGLVEYTSGREWVWAVPFTFHLTESWKVKVAPGFEHAEGENHYLTRVGTAYEFKFDGWSLAPEINADFVDHEIKTVIGVSIGWEF